MKVEVTNFDSGWQTLALGIEASEIDELINALAKLKKSKGHFHFRSNFEGEPSIGDIEIYFQTEGQNSDLKLEAQNAIT